MFREFEEINTKENKQHNLIDELISKVCLILFLKFQLKGEQLRIIVRHYL